MRNRLKTFWRDERASETTEMIGSLAILLCFVVVGIMMMSYILQLNNVNHAAKRVCRDIEVTGQVSQSRMNTIFDAYLGNSSQVTNRNVTISNFTEYAPGKIQLKNTFTITGTCDYVVPLINPGTFEGYSIVMPIKTVVSGMSEVYWP